MLAHGIAFSASLLAMSFATAVAAQEPVDAHGAAAANEEPAIGEIVVTAQRRSERLQDVPVAITAMSGDRLASVGVSTAQDIALVTPGLSMASVGGTLQPHLRGIGTSLQGPGVENPVALYVDGVYIANSAASLLTLSNIERVEVLKGPQGTLFGRNATGGLIQVITKDPGHDLMASAKLTYGNYDTFVGEAAVSGGVSENVAAGVAVRYEHQGKGWGRNLFDNESIGRVLHDLTVSGKIVATLDDATTAKIGFDYSDRKSDTSYQPAYPGYPLTFNNPFVAGAGAPFPQGGDRDVNLNFVSPTLLRTGGASLQINHEFDRVSFQSITAYREHRVDNAFDLDVTPVSLFAISFPVRGHQFSQEFQLSSIGEGRLKWVVGAYFFAGSDSYVPLSLNFDGAISPTAPAPFSIVIDGTVKARSYAGYGQASYEIVEGTKLTLGGRFTYEDKRVSGDQSALIGGFNVGTVPLPVPGSGIPAKIDFERFNYRISLDHKFGPDVLGYISYNTGFKSGGYNLANPANDPYKPEDIKAAEVGLKTQFFDKRLRFNIAGFYYRYKNIQIAQYKGGTQNVSNAAKAEIYGVDFDVDLNVGGGLSFTGGLGYVHDRFNDYPNADFFNGFGGCVTAPGSFCPLSAKGNKLPNSPTLTFNIGADYKREFLGGTIALNAVYSHSSRWYGAPDNYAYQPAYGTVNASAEWTDPSDHFSIRVWGKNLGDETYANGIFEGLQGVQRTLAAPRTYGVTVGAKF